MTTKDTEENNKTSQENEKEMVGEGGCSTINELVTPDMLE